MLKDLARIRGFVEESAMICGISPTDLPGVLLAVDEAVTNIILYGYDGGSGPG
jgi:anti-sigma regulatory factor (Ser/Thr protein kinase)